MIIKILEPEPEGEEEIIIRCHALSEELRDFINQFKERQQQGEKLSLYEEGILHRISPGEVLYFESVDQKVFAYGSSWVYETKLRLYELEEILPPRGFMRVTKSSILNIDQVESFAAVMGSRLEARLTNGEKIMISRQYVPVLRERLGM